MMDLKHQNEIFFQNDYYRLFCYLTHDIFDKNIVIMTSTILWHFNVLPKKVRKNQLFWCFKRKDLRIYTHLVTAEACSFITKGNIDVST